MKPLRPKKLKCNFNTRCKKPNNNSCINIRPKTSTKSTIKSPPIITKKPQLKKNKVLLKTKNHRLEILKLLPKSLLRKTYLTSKLANIRRLSIKTLERLRLKSTGHSTQFLFNRWLLCKFHHQPLNSLLSRLWPTNMSLIEEETR